jgi:hypothetical protein
VSGRRLGALIAGAVALALAGCASSPVLLDEDDVPGAERVIQNARHAVAPGWTWCSDLNPAGYVGADLVGSWFSFGGDVQAGANIIDRSSDGLTAERIVERFEDDASLCADAAAGTDVDGRSIEPLVGLDAGAVGWRTETGDGTWGELVLVPLDEWRLLAVGLSTDEDRAPVELDDLVRLARQGAEQLPADE